VFLKGLEPDTTKTEWVDKPYKAVLDIKEGSRKGSERGGGADPDDCGQS
jgi:hypothetical protein